MKHFHYILLFLLICTVSGCKHSCKKQLVDKGLSEEVRHFGDSAMLIEITNKVNGYDLSILHFDSLTLWRFQNGGSTRICAIDELPGDFYFNRDTVGIFKMELDIPVLRLDTITEDVPDMFFMDVDFDGHEELVYRHQGYNRNYYAYFNLHKGWDTNICPGILNAMPDEPFNNIVSMPYDMGYTVFDRKNKTIYVKENMGAAEYWETWYKQTGINGEFDLVKRYDHMFLQNADDNNDYYEHTHVFKMVDDTLKQVDTISRKIKPKKK